MGGLCKALYDAVMVLEKALYQCILPWTGPIIFNIYATGVFKQCCGRVNSFPLLFALPFKKLRAEQLHLRICLLPPNQSQHTQGCVVFICFQTWSSKRSSIFISCQNIFLQSTENKGLQLKTTVMNEEPSQTYFADPQGFLASCSCKTTLLQSRVEKAKRLR